MDVRGQSLSDLLEFFAKFIEVPQTLYGLIFVENG